MTSHILLFTLFHSHILSIFSKISRESKIGFLGDPLSKSGLFHKISRNMLRPRVLNLDFENINLREKPKLIELVQIWNFRLFEQTTTTQASSRHPFVRNTFFLEPFEMKLFFFTATKPLLDRASF